MMEGTWRALTCNGCGVSTQFLRVLTLRWQAGSGCTESPSGYMCAQCHAMVDAKRLIDNEQLTMKRDELKALEAELEEQHALAQGDAVSRQNDKARKENSPGVSTGKGDRGQESQDRGHAYAK